MHAPLPGERKRAVANDLVFALFGHVFHHHDHSLGAMDEIHRPTHPLDGLAGDDPVREVAILRDLHCAQHGHVDVTTADHGEGRRRIEVRRAGQYGDRLLAGVD